MQFWEHQTPLESFVCVSSRSRRNSGPYFETGAPAHPRARSSRRRGGARVPDAQGKGVLAALPPDA
jgi:hypothetical protein